MYVEAKGSYERPAKRQSKREISHLRHYRIYGSHGEDGEPDGWVIQERGNDDVVDGEQHFSNHDEAMAHLSQALRDHYDEGSK